jgi:hypothetical protein
MLELVRWSVVREWRESYGSVWAVGGELFALVLSLTIYWYSAQAFRPTLGTGAGESFKDYFDFILLGEISLLIPLVTLLAGARIVRRALQEGSFDAWVFHARDARHAMLASLAAAGLRVAPRVVLTLALAVGVFSLRFSPSALPAALALQLAAFPCFAGVGLIGAALVIRFGRGDSALAHFSTIIAVFSGAYFPLSVLPRELGWVDEALFPSSTLVEASRRAFSGAATASESLGHVGALLLSGALALALGWVAVGRALRHRRRSGAGWTGNPA